MPYADVLHFWFDQLTPAQQFVRDSAVDDAIRSRFSATWRAAQRCELWAWRSQPLGRLAEIIVLDQFSRNLFRDAPQAFAQDPQSLALAQELVAGQHDAAFTPAQRAFAYMPYMHSESLAVHDEALRLFAQPGLAYNLGFEQQHRDIIARFGRYPHRNAVLGRNSTPEELQFLTQPGSSF
jgi:uncharacterized protein (DUF924 family)